MPSASLNLETFFPKRLKRIIRILLREEPADYENGSFEYTKQTNSMEEEDSYIPRKQWSHVPTRSETKGRYASWLATTTFSLLLLSIRLSKPILKPQGPHSLWLAIIGMFNFILFVLATRVMNVSGTSFTQMQKTIMLVSFVASFLALLY